MQFSCVMFPWHDQNKQLIVYRKGPIKRLICANKIVYRDLIGSLEETDVHIFRCTEVID